MNNQAEKESRFTLYFNGRRDTIAAIAIIEYGNAGIVASAERDQITERQFEHGLEAAYPFCEFVISDEDGYWIARGS